MNIKKTKFMLTMLILTVALVGFSHNSTSVNASSFETASASKYVEVKSYWQPREYVKPPRIYYNSGGYAGWIPGCGDKGAYVLYCGTVYSTAFIQEQPEF